MDARFVLVELGKLMAQTDAHTRAIEDLSRKVAGLDQTVRAATLVGKVVVAFVGALAAAAWWLVSTLWPLRDKLASILLGGS